MNFELWQKTSIHLHINTFLLFSRVHATLLPTMLAFRRFLHYRSYPDAWLTFLVADTQLYKSLCPHAYPHATSVAVYTAFILVLYNPLLESFQSSFHVFLVNCLLDISCGCWTVFNSICPPNSLFLDSVPIRISPRCCPSYWLDVCFCHSIAVTPSYVCARVSE